MSLRSCPPSSPSGRRSSATAAGIASGQTVLDVACGTGIVARTAADLVAPGGTVIGLDLNEAMLTVARRVRPDIEFRVGQADDLPFPDGTFDAVVCQMALMFLPDRSKALAEMARVAHVGGTVAVLVPGALDSQPAFAPFVAMAARRAGPEAESLLTSYFVCGSLEHLEALVESAGLSVTATRTQLGTYRAPSVDAFVTTEVESTPLVERISADVYQSIRTDAHQVWLRSRPRTDVSRRPSSATSSWQAGHEPHPGPAVRRPFGVGGDGRTHDVSKGCHEA